MVGSSEYKSKQLFWIGSAIFGISFFLCPFGADLIWQYFVNEPMFGNGDFYTGSLWLYGLTIGGMLLGIFMMATIRGTPKWFKENWDVLLLIIFAVACIIFVFPYYFPEWFGPALFKWW